MKKSPVYKHQNVAIHKARAQLEPHGILDPWSGLDQIREMAAEINLGARSISWLNIEQRRALLLPQEVNALGSEEAIIFYEGLRPIRGRKIRYYQDRRFIARLLPPPERAAPEGSASAPASRAEPNAIEGTDGRGTTAEPVDSVPGFPGPEGRVVTREATVADLSRLESLTLEDFAVDFGRVQLPQKGSGERLTSQELQVAVESFLETLRSP